MKIFLFRHGNKQKSSSVDLDVKRAVSLSPLGIEQISKLADKLEKISELKKVKYIFSSPFPRTIQSAEIVRAKLKIDEIIADPRLSEYYAYNDYTKSKEYREDLHRKMLTNPKFLSPETKMTLQMYLDRTIEFFEEKFNEGHSTILVSAHGALIRSFIYSIDSNIKPPDEIILESSIHEGGYTELDFDGKKFKLIKFDVV